MKKQILGRALMPALFLVLAIVTVRGQTPSRVEVNIPFDFHAGTAKLEAGAYSVSQTSRNALTIRDRRGKVVALVNAPLTIGSQDSRRGARLVFNQYGPEYFLSQAWLSVDTGRQVFMTNAETKAARENRLSRDDARPRRVEVAARAR